MTTRTIARTTRRHALLIALSSAVAAFAAAPAHAQGPGGPNGVDVQIRAENRSTTDVPWCGIGGGSIGDRLHVDAFMTTGGVVTGTARFIDALGNETIIDLDRLFTFGGNFFPTGFGGGFLLQNQADRNTVPIWFNDHAVNPALVNVELPRGCGNTVSTFTPGLDKVTVQIKFR